ncbi:hypothetical protein B0H67DRAFT_679597 [Lasiosphaeris hirsuta]|uniref:Nephrocystin 3-like N-terminal domain-containing protein n=1 Tax=Lasiosphaeris hirsuta TaxID=260670 RepID=A0AA40BD97_9PEZI|nr:hypothetical protein B0H67DRAFT_679597 [Lasiosphaeris hirsuta]
MTTKTLAYGIEVLWEPPKPTKIDIDIVANGLRKAVGENVRILLFNKSSIRRGDALDTLSDSLLSGLQSARSGENAAYRRRPVVFIGHSTGGLIIASAVVMARVDRARFQGLAEAICGAIFIGTPFGGFSAAHLVANLDSDTRETVKRVESPLLGLLFPNIDNEAVKELTDNFRAAAWQGMVKMDLFFFYEGLKTDLSRLVPRAMGDSWAKFIGPDSKQLMVKNQHSNILAGYGSICVTRDHQNLVRFASCHDPGLTVILKPIKRVVKGALDMVERRFDEVDGGLIDHSSVEEVLKVLDDAEVEEQYGKMKKKVYLPSDIPCVLDSEEFTNWLSDIADHRSIKCLQISGRDGRGKGAAAVSAINNLKFRQSRTPMLLGYFFCRSMNKGELRAEMILRSLLRQLISQQRCLYRYATQFVPVGPTADGFPGPLSEAEWTLDNLMSAFCQILVDESVRAVYFVICGLDALDESCVTTKKLMDFLKMELEADDASSWSKSKRERNMKRRIDLDDGKYDAAALMRLRDYSNRKVSTLEHEKGYDKALSYFASSLIAKQANASGWGVGWIDIAAILLQDLPAHTEALEVRRHLERISQNLGELLHSKWKKILGDDDNLVLDETKEILRALLLCERNPTRGELAVLTGLSSERVWMLLGRCKPLLAEQEEGGAVVFAPGGKGGDQVMLHLRSASASLLGLDDDETKWQHGVLAWRCFIDLQRKPCRYSIEHWVSHAKLATKELAERISCEEDFWEMHSVVRRRWLGEYQSFFSSTSTNLNAAKYPNYLTAERSTGLHAATAVGYADLVSALMKRSRSKSRFGGECEENIHNGNGHIPLHLAAYQGRSDIIEILARETECEVCFYRPAEGHIMTPLAMAAIAGHDESLTKLLGYYWLCGFPREPERGLVINCAIRSGNVGTVKVLINDDRIPRTKTKNPGANQISDDTPYPHPLLVVAARSELEMVSLFLNHYEHGSSSPGVYLTLSDYSRAFSQSLENSRDDVTEFLLEKLWRMLRYGGHTECSGILQKGLDNAAQTGKWKCVNFFLAKGLLSRKAKWDDVIVAIANSASEHADILEKISKTMGESVPEETLAKALRIATLAKKRETVQVLLETFKLSANTTTRPLGSVTALTTAAEDGTGDLVTLLLKHGASVDPVFGWPLQAAAARGRTDIVRHLLKEGAEVNRLIRDARFPWCTALEAATERGHQGVVEVLLEHKADPNGGIGEKERYPIVAAAYLGYTDIFKMLLDHAAAEVDVFDVKFGGNPLIGAAGVLPTSLIQELLKKGVVDINANDRRGDTALIRAALAGSAETVRELLHSGADATRVNNRTVNALQAAREGGNPECLDLLIDQVLFHMSGIRLKPIDLARAFFVGQVPGPEYPKSEGDEETADEGGCLTPDYTNRTNGNSVGCGESGKH